MSDHTRIYRLPEDGLDLSDTQKPAFAYGNRTFELSDTEDSGWFYDKRTFKLSDQKELEFFYRKRLESISKEVLNKITSSWFQSFASTLSKQQMEVVAGFNWSKQGKSGQYKDFITCTSYS
jgi:hypothetical protein